jgi:hypothetical protein
VISLDRLGAGLEHRCRSGLLGRPRHPGCGCNADHLPAWRLRVQGRPRTGRATISHGCRPMQPGGGGGGGGGPGGALLAGPGRGPGRPRPAPAPAPQCLQPAARVQAVASQRQATAGVPAGARNAGLRFVGACCSDSLRAGQHPPPRPAAAPRLPTMPSDCAPPCSRSTWGAHGAASLTAALCSSAARCSAPRGRACSRCQPPRAASPTLSTFHQSGSWT